MDETDTRRDSDGFHVSWQQHGGTVCAGLQELQRRSEFVDMTLAADGHLVRVHQLVVGLGSPYLKQLIRSSPSPHPVVFLNNVSHKILCCILEYIYTGEVVVPAQDLRNFIQVGKTLHVKGLEELLIPEESSDAPQESTSAPQNRVLSVNPKETNVVIQKNYDNDVSTKAGKRKSATESPITTPKKRHIARDHEILHEDFDLDDATSDNDFKCNNADDGEPEESATNISEEEKPDNLKPQLMFCNSQRGQLQVILNRFIYNFAHAYKDGRLRWECIDFGSKKCRAMVITEDGKLYNRLNAHNHIMHDEKIMKRSKKGGIYTSLDSATERKSQGKSSGNSVPEV